MTQKIAEKWSLHSSGGLVVLKLIDAAGDELVLFLSPQAADQAAEVLAKGSVEAAAWKPPPPVAAPPSGPATH